MPDTDKPAPRLLLQPKAWKRFAHGAPWAFSNEIQMDNAAKKLPAGGLARLCLPEGDPAALVHFNPHSLIAARALSRDPADLNAGRMPDGWLAARIERARALRDRLYGQPFYRLVHAEADGLPGLVVDRFGDVFVVQANTAGMDRLLPAIDAALVEDLGAETIVHRLDSPSREAEGLTRRVEVAHGALDGPVRLEENGCTFLADLEGGQKTGWFYDHRDNRAFAARLAAGGRVLDLFGYAGGFALPAAKAGAASVVSVDRSAEAQALAARAAEESGVADRVSFEKADVFHYLERAAEAGASFDLVIADPPAFAKSRKETKQAVRAYRKLARLAAAVTAPGGALLLASCSHHVDAESFLDATRRGLAEAGREGRLIRRAGAGPDHPIHPHLPESAYLKALVYTLE